MCKKLAPSTVDLPLIFGSFRLSIHIDAVLHRKADVVLSIRQSSDLRDCPHRNNLGDKNNASAVLIALLAADVESQIHLIKIGMEGNRKRTKELCFPKLRAHHKDSASSLLASTSACYNFVTLSSGSCSYSVTTASPATIYIRLLKSQHSQQRAASIHFEATEALTVAKPDVRFRGWMDRTQKQSHRTAGLSVKTRPSYSRGDLIWAEFDKGATTCLR